MTPCDRTTAALAGAGPLKAHGTQVGERLAQRAVFAGDQHRHCEGAGPGLPFGEHVQAVGCGEQGNRQGGIAMFEDDGDPGAAGLGPAGTAGSRRRETPRPATPRQSERHAPSGARLRPRGGPRRAGPARRHRHRRRGTAPAMREGRAAMCDSTRQAWPRRHSFDASLNPVAQGLWRPLIAGP
jgi:hypothetical protein